MITVVVILTLALGVTLGLWFVTLCCLHDTQQECGRWRDGYSEARRRQADAERARDTYRLYADQARIRVALACDTSQYEQATAEAQHHLRALRDDLDAWGRGER